MADRTPPPALLASNALFLDFDGTLAPIVDDPQTAQLLDGLGPVLEDLAGRLDGALAVISGRDIDDLSSRVPKSLCRMGNHGMNVLLPGEESRNRTDVLPAPLEEGFETLRQDYPDILIEKKGAVLAMHYRACPDAKDALEEAAADIVSRVDGYKAQHGKMIVEAKPVAANKGEAILEIMKQPPFAERVPVMVGDDVTDEDGFRAVMQLGGSGIKVGNGDTSAAYWLASQEAVKAWLEQAVR